MKSRIPPVQAVPAPSEMPPRVWVLLREIKDKPGKFYSIETHVCSISEITGKLSPTPTHISVEEHTALISAEREKGRREGMADMLKQLSDEIDAMGCGKAMFSVTQLMMREKKIRETKQSAGGGA